MSKLVLNDGEKVLLPQQHLNGALHQVCRGVYDYIILYIVGEYTKGIPSNNQLCCVRAYTDVLIWLPRSATDLSKMILQDVVAKEAGRAELCLHVQ